MNKAKHISICILIHLSLYSLIKKLLSTGENNKIKPLHAESFFIACLSIPLFFSLLFFTTILFTTGWSREFDFTSNGFEEFLKIYKFPLWTLLGSPALAALAAAMHRSRETNEVIKKTEEKNTFDNYIKHKESITEELARLEVDFKRDGQLEELLNKDTIYSRLYPDNYYDCLAYTIPKALKDDLLIFIENMCSLSKKDLGDIEITTCLNSYNSIFGLMNIRYKSEIIITSFDLIYYTFPSENNLPDDPTKEEKIEILTKVIANGFNLAFAISYKILLLSKNKETSLSHFNVNAFSSSNIKKIASNYWFKKTAS